MCVDIDVQYKCSAAFLLVLYQCCIKTFILQNNTHSPLGWLVGVVVRVLDSRWAGREFDSHAAAALSGNNLGQVVHTNVLLFTKQYNLVPCEGFHVNAPVCGSHFMGSYEQGGIVVAVLKRSDRLEPRYKLSTLLFTLPPTFFLQISRFRHLREETLNNNKSNFLHVEFLPCTYVKGLFQLVMHLTSHLV